MKRNQPLHIVCLSLLAAAALPTLAGPLNPPAGPVAPTHKTLTEVEPRTAINATNTPGDADSLYRITQNGSYYRTGHVVVPGGRAGIEVSNGTAANVSIDLNGFTIEGQPGSLAGIRTLIVPGGSSLSIRNGNIKTMGGSGIDVYAQACAVSDVSAQFCGGDGIRVDSTAGTVTNCRAHSNSGDGFHLGVQSTISGCTSILNMGDGFDVLAANLVTSCTSQSNSGMGIVTLGSGSISNCLVSGGSDGIRVASSCVITRNQVSGASLAGIHVTGNGNRIEENQVSGSPTGYLVDGANGNVVVKNTARGNATPYSVPVGNFVGALVNTAAGVTSANAWANFAY